MQIFDCEKQLTSEKVHNTEESGHNYHCPLSKSLAAENKKTVSGHKISKEKVTILHTNDISGTPN